MFPAPGDYFPHIVSLPIVWISLGLLLALSIVAARVRIRRGRNVAFWVIVTAWLLTTTIQQMLFATNFFAGREFVATGFITAIAIALVAAPALLVPSRLGWLNLAMFGAIGALLAAVALPWGMVLTWCSFGIDCL
jgi:hypothetical protein